MTTDLVLQALLMAVWQRQPPDRNVMMHSDLVSQFNRGEWQRFLRQHNLAASMSRRGNCHNNAVAESFFYLLKRERFRRQIVETRKQLSCQSRQHTDICVEGMDDALLTLLSQQIRTLDERIETLLAKDQELR